jgi:hypothetical protein
VQAQVPDDVVAVAHSWIPCGWVVSTPTAVSPLMFGMGRNMPTDPAACTSAMGLAGTAGVLVVTMPRLSSPCVLTVLPEEATAVQRMSASTLNWMPVTVTAPVVMPTAVASTTLDAAAVALFLLARSEIVSGPVVAFVVIHPRAVTRISMPTYHPYGCPAACTTA